MRRVLPGLVIVLTSCSSPALVPQAHVGPVEPARTVSAPPPAEPEAPSAPPAPPAPPPPESGIAVLDVPGHHPAVVWVPPIAAGDAALRPLLVATHGAGGTPEAQCTYWSALVGERAFVLCPRGVTMDVYAPPEERGYFYPAHPALGREVRAALSALVARYRDHVDRDRAVYAGFSQGATMGALFFGKEPAPFVGAVLIEGGAEEWSQYSARTFQQGGGRRVIFACGRASCAGAARRSASYLEQAGVESRVVHARGAGHTPGGKVRDAVAEAFPWLVADDARWASR